MKYMVVAGKHIVDLECSVDQFLKDGWVCQGGVMGAVGQYFHQAMVKPDPVSRVEPKRTLPELTVTINVENIEGLEEKLNRLRAQCRGFESENDAWEALEDSCGFMIAGGVVYLNADSPALTQKQLLALAKKQDRQRLIGTFFYLADDPSTRLFGIEQLPVGGFMALETAPSGLAFLGLRVLDVGAIGIGYVEKNPAEVAACLSLMEREARRNEDKEALSYVLWARNVHRGD